MQFLTHTRISHVAILQGVQLVFGALFYLLVLAKDNFEFLGKLSISYAVFVIVANVLTLGLHEHQYSVYDKRGNARPIFINLFLDSALYLSGIGVLGVAICFLTDLPPYMMVFVVAICLASLNKLVFGYSNSINLASYSASIQTIRVGCFFSLLAFTLIYRPDDHIFVASSFIGPELMILYLFHRKYDFGRLERRCTVLPKVIKESIKLMPHLFCSELFFRTDILVLSIYLTDRYVGIYAFFGIIIAGVMQVLYGFKIYSAGQLLRIVRAINSGRIKMVVKHVRRISVISFGTCFFMICGGIIFVFIVEPWNPVPLGYIEFLLILSAGLLVYSIVYPFDSILVFAGQPGWQSLYAVAINFVNVSLNFFLVPKLGMGGAALATCVSLILATVLVPTLCILRLKKRSTF